MNNLYPIFTLKNECYDCYKCIRECNVKAIKIENGHASVISEKCIACGHCVIICPQNAKKSRNDIEKVKNLLKTKKNIIVSLAPSWSSVYECNETAIITALKKLGFYEVSETALGAQEVSASIIQLLEKHDKPMYISSACPAIVDYIRIYMPEFVEHITPIASPALTHSQFLKNQFGKDTEVVFIGPCIAKKNESDKNPEIMANALTFKEFDSWLISENINLNKIKSSKMDKFVPQKAHEGNLYPLEFGMSQALKLHKLKKNVQFINISSIPSLKRYLKNLDIEKLNETIFIEALACEGGCINGPCASNEKSTLLMTSEILKKTKYRKKITNIPCIEITKEYTKIELNNKSFSQDEINETLKSIGKYSKKDELDCGGCGYDTCQKLASALLAKEAEPSMCISYMRRINMQKAGAMLRCMPSAVVMTDNSFKVLESNDAFAKMFAKEIYEYYSSTKEGLTGAAIERLLPCVDIFKKALKTGKDIHHERYPINEKLYDITAFTIEPDLIVGAIITDVTKTEMKREQISKKAQEVISKNISTVQNIACLLGEHMAETELLLNSIAEGYETDSKK